MRKGRWAMTPEELQEAQTFVCARPEYGWVCSHPDDTFTISDIARYTHLSRDSVRNLIEDGAFPGSVRYSETIGWRVPRTGLVEFYAGQLGWKSGQQAG